MAKEGIACNFESNEGDPYHPVSPSKDGNTLVAPDEQARRLRVSNLEPIQPQNILLDCLGKAGDSDAMDGYSKVFYPTLSLGEDRKYESN